MNNHRKTVDPFSCNRRQKTDKYGNSYKKCFLGGKIILQYGKYIMARRIKKESTKLKTENKI